MRNIPLDEALIEARTAYAAARPRSREIHEAATLHMPGGNTRTVLFHGPFPLRAAGGEGAILHDVDKPMIYRYDGNTFSYAEGRTLRDHGALGAELCVEHGIPLEIAEMVRHHSAFASQGLPGTVEGTIVHYADWVSNDFAAVLMGVETIHASTRPVPKERPVAG